MDQATQPKASGSYTANLLGNIRSHLAGLQGYDVMALELIQNADDAKAEEILFDITDSGLLVRNSGQFTYCGDLDKPCAFPPEENYKCDYHRITDVGSGGKLSRGENIGRFGIGFVSTYQVTDHPEIRSSGIKLALYPERGQWFIEAFEEPNGTSFFLPWADNPNTEARLALGVSHVSPAHIDQIADDFQTVLRKSLLFLRHVQKAEVRRNGQLLLACDLDRSDGSDLIVSFSPSGIVEHWQILRADAADMAQRLYMTHPRLETLHRSTKISIGLRIDPEPLAEGLLYAFLPTEQSTGLPLHINADFFPESDRKALIFAGHQHEQAWNEMLIDAAAVELARDPEGLLQMLGPVQLWQILGRAYDLSSKPSGHPPCFKRFWERLKATATQAHIAGAQDGSLQRPNGVFLPRSPLNEYQAKALLEAGGRLVAEELRPFLTAMNQLGAPILTLERLVVLLESAMAQQVAGAMQVNQERLEHFYRPLWSIINDLLPESGTANLSANPSVQRLQALPFVITEDLFAVTINQSYVASAALDAERIAALLPRLAIASRVITELPKITRLIKLLDLNAVVSHISSMCETEPVEKVIGVDPKDLRDTYSLFADLDHQATVEKTVYQKLRGLPIWPSSRGLVKANQALLPGNFIDPTGQADLLDVSVLTESARDFLSTKLGVQTQTIEAFVQTVLPTFFGDDGPLDATKFSQLISELANHPTLVNDDDIRRLLGSLPIAPTQDGGWSRPINTYRRTDDLVKVLGDAIHLWLDASRVPNTRSVHTFIDSLGIRRSPIARHLVDRMLSIAEKYLPTENAKRASSEAFYVLCDNYENWKEKKAFQDALDDLQQAACFPADGDTEEWHIADSLYAPYRADAFRSQANILDFRNTVRLKTDLLEKLNVAINPETQRVINHLQHCITMGVQPHVSTYQVLNERAQRSDPLIATLAGSRCIYVESQKTFVRPNQLYWVAQQLGRYAYTIPGNYESFKPLFDAIGVKNAPAGRDFIDILLDIVGEYFEQSKAVTGPDRAVYDICLTSVSSAHEHEELTPSDLRRLQEAPTILNLQGQLTHPDEVLLQDSEWHAGFFVGELDQALCKPAPELWPFIEMVGVRRLSESAQVALEFVDGPEANESALAEKLMDRMDILARLLHDKPTTVQKKIRVALSGLEAVSHNVVRIQASVHVGGDQAIAPPTSAQAFYEPENGRLILARPVSDRSWAHILNALFHQLMPEESGSEISKLTLSVRPLMGMTVEEAHRELSDAGIPYLDAEASSVGDLTSPDLDEMSGATEPSSRKESDTAPAPDESSDKREPHLRGKERKPRTEDSAHQGRAEPSERPGRGEGSESSGRDASERNGSTTREGGSTRSVQGEQRAKKSRPKHKEQWDRRLLSYVRQKQETSSEPGDQEGPSEHNLAVEIVAREAVCAYERERGRVPEQMAQTHPGYDIISRNPMTGEDRFVEVKGVNGEWNQTGVGLSRLQFSNAQDYGNRYWLYVVEFVSDPEHIRVHPIRSPAAQVTAFMFDGNWRDAVKEERAEPSALFIPGARIQHQDVGCGEIRDVVTRGNTKLLTVLFDGKSQATPNVILNLHRMRIMEDSDDNNDS
ncbi:protein NO VEIN domain-containing protein [Pseudomonas monsensis]